MNKYKLNLSGKNINYLLNRIINLNIELINIEYLDDNNINIIIYEKDYQKIKKIKTTYKIKIIDKYGYLKYKDILSKNKILLIMTIIGILFLIFLSNIIFDVKVVHEDENIRNILYNELNKYGISIHKFKKNRNEINIIKNKILEEYKDKIEWLEIENVGTSYIVRVEERIIPDKIKNNSIRNVIAKKNAVIYSIEANSGVIVKDRGNYVNKGDILISSEIKLNDEVKANVSASGIVYGEVWYTNKISYPYVYQEEIKTNNVTTNLIFHIFNKEYIIYGDKYKYYNILKEYRSTILPIYFSLEKRNMIKKIDDVLTCDQASKKAINNLNEKINSKLNDKEKILETKILKTNCLVDRVEINVFYSVLENITDYEIID